MSRENVEAIRRLVELWNAGDRGLGGIGRYLDQSIELESPFSSVSGVPYRGHSGIEQWRSDIDEQFSEWRLTLEDVRDLTDTVVAIGDVHGRGRGSGIVVDFPAAVIVAFGSDSMITRLRIYLNVKEALKAAGLEE